MKKLLLLFFPVFLFSCGNKLKDTVWTCTVVDKYSDVTYKIEFLTGNECAIEWKSEKDEFNNSNALFCTYKFENSNLVFYYDIPNRNRIIYDIGTIENNNCIKLRNIANGNCFTKIK